MEGKDLFEYICRKADEHRANKMMLNELWQVLKTNRTRMTDIEFSFAAEHIGTYFEQCENTEDGVNFERKTSSD